MSIFSVSSGSGNNFYNMFSNTSGSGNNNAAAGIFSGGSTAIGDLSLIKSGAYKKLLNAYYDVQKPEKGRTSSSSSTTASKFINGVEDSTGKLQSAKNDASSLSDALKKLSNRSLYMNKRDEKGNLVKGEKGEAVYDTEAIGKAVKEFVESYNSFIDSTGNLNSTKMLSKTLDVIKTTSKNAGLLADIGIRIGSDNKLKLDEDKLKEAKVSTINSLFTGSGSYGSNISAKANESFRIASSSSYAGTRASSYTYSGAYSTLGTTNVLSKYM